jgi:hypothetical protein
MEEDTIISFVQNMESDEEKTDIYDELEDIKRILSQRKMKSFRKGFGDDRAVHKLKQEVSRLED